MPNANEDVELARAWLRGEGKLMDDLADLVESMTDKRLDPEARTFISTIGRDAKAMAKGNARPAPARIEAQTAAQPSPDAPPAPTIDINELWRRRQERNRAQRLDELSRRNAEAWSEQAAMLDPTRRF
jgi:hypothetical protein